MNLNHFLTMSSLNCALLVSCQPGWGKALGVKESSRGRWAGARGGVPLEQGALNMFWHVSGLAHGESPPVLFFGHHFLQNPVFSESGGRDQLLVWTHVPQAPGGGILLLVGQAD